MPSTAAYTVKRSRVFFTCDHCKADVNCPLSDAGSAQNCPECRAVFRVPGEAEAAIERQESDRRLAKKHEAEAAELRANQRQAAANAAVLVRSASRGASHGARSSPRTWSLSLLGLLLLFVGLTGLGFALFMSTSVEVPHAVIPGYLDKVQNMGLMNDRLCLVVFGSAASGFGFLMLALARVGEEIHALRETAKRDA